MHKNHAAGASPQTLLGRLHSTRQTPSCYLERRGLCPTSILSPSSWLFCLRV